MSISSVTSIATAGLQSAFARLDASAQRTAVGAASDDYDPGREVVEQIDAKTEARANISVLKTADEMLGDLLDIKV